MGYFFLTCYVLVHIWFFQLFRSKKPIGGICLFGFCFSWSCLALSIVIEELFK